MAVDIKLKHSQYNIIKQKRKTYLLYNSLFNSMLTMSVHEFEQYKNIEFNDLSLVETVYGKIEMQKKGSKSA